MTALKQEYSDSHHYHKVQREVYNKMEMTHKEDNKMIIQKPMDVVDREIRNLDQWYVIQCSERGQGHPCHAHLD